MTSPRAKSEYLVPSFFIVGERKCGTSSLYRYLLEHPAVLPGIRKEMQFFTKGAAAVEEGWEDYLQSFPKTEAAESASLDWPELDADGILYEERLDFERPQGTRPVTGEASADTFCDADPGLLKRYLPNLRLVVLLRDPVERAFSHHRMFRRFQEEGRELGFAVGEFESDMRREVQRAGEGEATPVLSPGIYLPNLLRWQAVWGASLHLVFSSDLGSPQKFPEAMDSIRKHLGLAPHPFELRARYNQAPPARMPEAARAVLRDFYAPHDNALAKHLGCALPWQSS